MEVDIDPKKVVSTEAFRAINVLIDQKAIDLKNNVGALKDRMLRLATETPMYPPYITTRTHEERGGDHTVGQVEVLYSERDLDDLKYYIGVVERLKIEINSLLLYKLELLNDYDFTHGDPETHVKVFGDKYITK